MDNPNLYMCSLCAGRKRVRVMVREGLGSEMLANPDKL